MRSSPMFFPGMVYAVLALATFLVSVECVLTAFGKPLFPAFFAELAAEANAIDWETSDVGNFLSQLVLLAQLICLVIFVICRKISNRIITPQRQYASRDELHEFARAHLLLYCLGNLFLLLSFIAHFIEAIPRGEMGEFFLLCIFPGIPGLMFAAVALPITFYVIFYGEFSEYSYCESCDCGSKNQFRISDSQHLYDRVEYETTTTKRGDKLVDSKTRQTKRESVYRNTYSCINCGDYFKKTEGRR